METKLVTLSDGRKLELQIAGTPQKSAVVFHHGTPGATNTWTSWMKEVERLGGFTFSYSRPGYGQSDRNEGRTVSDNANDISEVLELLGITKIVSIGWSGGGPHALTDKKAIIGGAAEGTAASYRKALEVSYYGWLDDDLAFVQPWGFDIGKISVPVELWHGNDDFMVPHAHGYWLDKHIPSAKWVFVPGEGHTSLGKTHRSKVLESTN